MNDILRTLIRHEGYRQFPYLDTVGKLTVGIGRNLADVGISKEEALILLGNDVKTARDAAVDAFPWFKDLNYARQDVITMMIFNMGMGRVRGFKKMITAIEARDYALAAAEMLDSKWAAQVGERARELAAIMRGDSAVPPSAEIPDLQC